MCSQCVLQILKKWYVVFEIWPLKGMHTMTETSTFKCIMTLDNWSVYKKCVYYDEKQTKILLQISKHIAQ